MPTGEGADLVEDRFCRFLLEADTLWWTPHNRFEMACEGYHAMAVAAPKLALLNLTCSWRRNGTDGGKFVAETRQTGRNQKLQKKLVHIVNARAAATPQSLVSPF